MNVPADTVHCRVDQEGVAMATTVRIHMPGGREENAMWRQTYSKRCLNHAAQECLVRDPGDARHRLPAITTYSGPLFLSHLLPTISTVIAKAIMKIPWAPVAVTILNTEWEYWLLSSS